MRNEFHRGTLVISGPALDKKWIATDAVKPEIDEAKHKERKEISPFLMKKP